MTSNIIVNIFYFMSTVCACCACWHIGYARGILWHKRLYDGEVK